MNAIVNLRQVYCNNTECFTRLLLSKRFIAFQWEVIYKMPQQPTCEGWKSCQPWWKHNTAMTHTYLYTHTLNNLRTQRKKEQKKSFHLQLFSTFQREPFSQSPTIQQSIPAYTLALFWVSAVVNIDSVRLIRPDSMQPHKTIADRLKANPFLQETNKNVTGVLCFEPMYSYVLTQGEALIYTCSQTKLTVNNCVALNA